MYHNSFLKIVLSTISIFFLFSCDKDFNSIGGDLVGGNNFNFSKETYDVVSYNQKIGAIQSNNLPLNALGIYDDPVFGTTTANFVTQLSLDLENPDTRLGEEYLPEVESVILTIPYSSTLKSVDGEGNSTYELNSIYGNPEGKIKLSVYESGYYLRSLDPDSGFKESQRYYTDQNDVFDDAKIGERLNNSEDVFQNDAFFFDKSEIVTTIDETTTKTAPQMQLYLNKEFFQTKIIDAVAQGKLATNDVFKEYFRGLYFKVERATGEPANLAMLNFKAGKITINYKRNKSDTDDTRIDRAIVLNLSGNTVSLLSHENSTAYTDATSESNVNVVSGDDRLYLKGGEGSMAVLELFKNEGELEDLRSKGWLINEANLVFHVDQDIMSDNDEPYRIYLYDLNNSSAVVDYLIDGTSGTTAYNGKYIYGGILNKEDAEDGVYKFRITSHIRNLLKNTELTNVKLGVVVTDDINNNTFNKLRQTNSEFEVPQASVTNPLGTVLFGGTSGVPEDKRLKLEIYYTKPNN